MPHDAPWTRFTFGIQATAPGGWPSQWMDLLWVVWQRWDGKDPSLDEIMRQSQDLLDGEQFRATGVLYESLSLALIDARQDGGLT